MPGALIKLYTFVPSYKQLIVCFSCHQLHNCYGGIIAMVVIRLLFLGLWIQTSVEHTTVDFIIFKEIIPKSLYPRNYLKVAIVG